MPKANQNPNTTRNTSSRCVMARITRNGEKHQKNFTLRQYGTWKAAQAAADKWVAETKRALPPPAPRKDRMTRRNSSGIVGVWAFLDDTKKNTYCRWYARWPGCPNRGGVSFSADRMGDDDAFACAYLARKYETVDREWILRKLESFKRTKQYKEILKLKSVDFV
jgi:hypothetical protein